MQVRRSTEIQATPSRAWAIITDIENAADKISGIKSIEVLEPAQGPSIVGLKWRETRAWMGKDAVETMWVTDAKPESFYETRAESHGAVYVSRLALEPIPDGIRLTMGFTGEPVTARARFLWALTGWMAKRALRKTIDEDLKDLKAAIEATV